MRTIRSSRPTLRLVASILAPTAVLTATAQPPAPPPREAAASANRFASELFGVLAKEHAGNYVFSPFSIHAALSMVAAGAANDTEAQLIGALKLPADREARAAAIKSLRDRMEAAGAKGDITLEVANRVWVQKSYPLLPAFTKEVEGVFGAGFASADFATAAEPTRREINGWVEDRTRKRIRDLVPPGALSPATRMVLVNAIYFYGTWEEPFPKERTESAPFHVAADRDVKADLMQAHREHTGYREEDGLQVCELPYKGRGLSMVVLLPAAGKLGDLEARVARDGFDAVCGRMGSRTVNVALPRFKIEAPSGLNEPLKSLGIRDAFDAERADFSGMTGKRDLCVSDAIHKAFIEVNEKGTEAAAATMVAMVATSAPIMQEPVTFRADRPFLFALRDRLSGAILFVGRVENPTAK